MVGDLERDFRGILYVFDSLRLDNIGCYGYSRNVTPAIDSVAADGSRFENSYSQAIWTYPSAGSIFTGLYPRAHGSQQFDEPLNPDHPHIADGFVGTDVTTACFSTTLGVSPVRGFEQGFDEFYHIDDGKAGLRPDVMDILNEKLLPWVKRHSDNGFFVVVWAMGTHHPYRTPHNTEDPTKPLRTGKGTAEWLSSLSHDRVDEVHELYNDVVEYSDRSFGALVEVLRSEDIYEKTTLLVTSDHGEIFDEHARYEYVPPPVKHLVRTVVGTDKCRSYGLFDPSAFLGHQDTFPYEELINVPLIYKPSRAAPRLPEIVERTVELIDLLPTVHDLGGLRDAGRAQGTSLLTPLDEAEENRFVFTRSQVHKGNVTYASVHDNQHKLCTRTVELGLSDLIDSINVGRIGAHLLGRNSVLLDRSRDEVLVNDADVKSQMLETLLEHIRSCKEFRKSATPNHIHVAPETERHLADLGYK